METTWRTLTVLLIVLLGAVTASAQTGDGPALEDIGDISVNETETVTIVLNATDPDNDTLTYSTDASCGIMDGNIFTWTTGYEDAGTHYLNFGVSDGELYDNTTVNITVDNVNRQPTFVGEIGDIVVNETETVTIALNATDPDNDTLTYSTNAPYGSRDGNVFTWTTGYDDAGTHYLNFGVSDGELYDNTTVNITVDNVNRQPTFVGEIGDIVVNETETVTIALNATDPDNDTLTYSTNAPYGSRDGNVFTWTTGYDDAGEYYWWFDVSDGSLSSSTSVKIMVNDVNRPPEFDVIEDVSVNETETVTIALNATDQDNDTLTYSTDAPYGILDGNVFTWTTGYDDAGTHYLNFGVSDGELSDDVTVKITVNDVTRQPTLVCEPAYISVDETETVTITLAATDPDNDTLTYSTDAPYGILDGNVFTWTTGYDDEGVHYPNFGVSDGELSDNVTVELTVNHVNRPPEFEPIGNKTEWEGQKLQFKVDATDAPDNDPLTYSCVDLPNGAEFGIENQQFTWTPTYTQSGVYNVTFAVTDGIDTASETIAITVTDVHADAGEDQMVHTGDLVTLDASETTGVLFGAEFIWTEDGERLTSISFSKHFGRGIHNITLTVKYRDGYTDTDLVNVTVCSTPPVADAGADQQVISAPVTLDGRGSDSDGGIESYEWTWVERGEVIGTSPVVTYSFPPGIHTVSLKVTDNDDSCYLTDTDTVTIEVISSPPVASAGNDLIVKHGEDIAISGYRSTDNTKIISYKWIDNSGTILSGDMNYTTNLLPVGRNEVTLEVEDEIGEIGTDKVVITVLSDPPVANAGNDASISLGQTVVLDGSNSYDGVGSIMSWRWVDMDGTTLSYSERYTFDSVDFGIGNHEIILIVTDDTGEIGRDEVIVTVRSDPPIADAGPDVLKRVGEKVTLSATGSYDTNGTIVGYEWISSEGGNLLSSDVSFDNYYREGDHTIVLTVTDDAGETDIDTVVVSLVDYDPPNQPPTAHAGKDKTVDRNEWVHFDGSGSKDDNGIVSYSWDFGDGASGSGESPQHPYTDEGSYIVTLTVADSDGLTSSNTLDVTVIGKRRSTLSIAASPTEVVMYNDLTVSGSISPQPENPAVVTLTFTSPTGRTVVETVSSDSSGSYSLDYRPIEDGVWSVCSEWDGDDNLFGDVSETITFTVTRPPYARYGIIIVGSGEGGGSQQYINRTANRAYQVLLQRGFTNESIFYLNPADQDYTVDRVSSLSNISYAITEWTQDKVNSETPLFVYLVDHGGNDEFYVKGYSEKLTSAKLDEYLDRVTSTTGCRDIVVVYDACNSGSFINELSGDGRIVITSTGESANAGIDTTGALFSTYFFNSISDARTIKEAFEDASNSPDIIAYSIMLIAAGMSPQTPLLDDNGDEVGHAIEPQLTGDGELLVSTGDGELAASTYIGPQVGALNLPPAITDTGVVQSQIETDKSIWIWATVCDDRGAFNGSVYATIIAPSYRVYDVEDTLFEMNLTTLNLEDSDADGNYTASFTPTESGDYTMILHATDQEGNIASPVLLTLGDVNGDIKGDVNGDDGLTSADAVLALQMAASGQYNNAADVNHDGSVTSLDALMIQQACAGKIVLSG